MTEKCALSLGALLLAQASTAHAAGNISFPQRETASAPLPAAADRATKESDRRHDQRDGWMLSLEGVGTAPLDIGAQVGVEAPFGLRVFGGYGWIPAASLRLLDGTSIAKGPASAKVAVTDASGHIVRLKLGIRPFSKLGFYLDAGYARAELLADVNVTGSVSDLGSISGAYRAESSLDLWLVDLGYQWRIEDRLVVGLGLGFVGTLNARTTITPAGTGPAVDATTLGMAETSVNGALEAYGFVPTLSLRVGFNVL